MDEHDLIARLLPPDQQAPALRLLQDPDSRTLVRQQLSQIAEDEAGVIPQKSFNWILCKLSTFGARETDTLRIYQAFTSQLHHLGHFCRMLSGEGTLCQQDPPATVANRITIGLGLFYEEAARRHQHRAAPSPEYYQRVAAGCFAVTGYKRIAADLPDWVTFLQENFASLRN